jgi:hypothetical protein
MAQEISIGRTVRYGIGKDADGSVVERPAVVVRVCDKDTGTVNLQVFLDGLDGDNDACEFINGEQCRTGLAWKTNVTRADVPTVGSWWWPPRG